jgi:uncharacterized membrane protein
MLGKVRWLKRKPRGEEVLEFIFYLSFFLVSLYLFICLLSPLLIQSSNRILLGLGAVSYLFNILMCHQLPERSLELFGQHMPICSRDTGLFSGMFAACVLAFISSKLPKIFRTGWLAILSVVPLAMDGVMQFLGFWESTDAIRFATGFIAGFFISYYAINVFIGQPRLSRKALRAALALSPLILIILAASFYVGGAYQTKAEILTKAKAINNAMDIKLFYIAPRAFSSAIAKDEYVAQYNDTVLKDAARIGGGGNPYGVWVATASNISGGYNGRYVFASGNGTNYFYDAMSGKLITEFEH